LQHLSHTLGIAQNFLWLDERQDLVPFYNAFDIFCSSSAYGEGFSNVICEAMACGVPCVVTDVGDARQIVGPTGTVVPPRDPVALAQGWQDLLALSPVSRRQLGEKARERIKINYSLDRCVRDYESLYESLLEQ
jgi:glycosyltransferase involved in cell wall biosynthesis